MAEQGDNNELVGSSWKAQDLVGYQPGAVVSRTLIDHKVGTLTVFAFAAGQGLSEHTAPYHATLAILEGRAEITIDGKARLVQAGEWIIMPANHPHAVKALEPFKMMLIMIRE